MSKKRDALRRGIRSLIHDTSRELAALEGRPRPAEVPPIEPRADAPESDTVSPPASLAASLGLHAGPEVGWIVGPEHAVPDHAGTEQGAQAAAQALNTGQQGAQAGAVQGAQAAATQGVQAAATQGVQAAASDAVSSDAAPPRPVRAQRSKAGSKASRSDRTARPAARPARSAKRPRPGRRPARRVGAETSSNGVNPEQAHARKGVCFAYFINHECWRVPDAYCNTALQVCAIRTCPIYHLHREMLERRFAGKFKHFW